MKFAGALLKPMALSLGAIGIGTGAYAIGNRNGFNSYNPPQIIDHLALSIQEARPDLTINEVYYEATKAFDKAVGNSKASSDNFMYGIDADKQDSWEKLVINPREKYGYELVTRTDIPIDPQGSIYTENGKWAKGTPWENGQSFTVY